MQRKKVARCIKRIRRFLLCCLRVVGRRMVASRKMGVSLQCDDEWFAVSTGPVRNKKWSVNGKWKAPLWLPTVREPSDHSLLALQPITDLGKRAARTTLANQPRARTTRILNLKRCDRPRSWDCNFENQQPVIPTSKLQCQFCFV